MFELMRKVSVKKRRDSILRRLRAEELTEFAEIMGDWLSCGFESYHAGWRKRDGARCVSSIDGNKINAAFRFRRQVQANLLITTRVDHKLAG